ncbi:MAG: alginate O-acetyltransferase complex protein AlgI [Chlamydiales bacterium]
MLFNSIEFLIFIVIVLTLYALLTRRLKLQNWLILVSSYAFYGWWDVRFLFLITLSTVIDFSSALMIDRGRVDVATRVRLSLSLLLGGLFFVTLPYDDLLSGLAHGRAPDLARANWNALLGVGLVVALMNAAYGACTRLPEARRRKLFLIVSLCANLGLLGVFKYFDFFASSFAALWAQVFGTQLDALTLNIVLPVGISFYTFQTMSYTIDVYRRSMKSSDNLLQVAAYVAFFPQLVAGPIERSSHLLPQFAVPRRFDRQAIRSGLWLIFWGLYKKMVVADNMARIANDAFRPYDEGLSFEPAQDGLRLLVGLYAFAFQIYGDFSGYTDIARGVAKLMGFDLRLNFNLPYFATSPSSFWRRWHISLSTWLRDYLYIGLGGNKGGAFNTYRNLSLTMLLGGLWHGASWTFVVWGAYHGALLVIYRLVGVRTESRKYSWWANGLMGLWMFHLTCIGWLLFRAQNLETIGVFLSSIVWHPGTSALFWEQAGEVLRIGWFLIAFQVVQGITGRLEPLQGAHWFVRLNVWIMILMSLLALSSPERQEFIYFAF